MAAATELNWHLGIVTQRLQAGKVIPFLGAGANLCGRQSAEGWRPAVGLPSGGELAAHLIEQFFGGPDAGYPADEPRDLVRVSQFVGAVIGSAALHDQLHNVFDHSYEPNRVHRFLARLPQLLSGGPQAPESAQPVDRPMIVTTNYDDPLERAFDDAGEPYDLVFYVARGRHRGRFVHRRMDGHIHVITRPNSYREFVLAERTVILKLHGAVDRLDSTGDSYVITEDDYIEYLARPEAIPAQLLAKMRQSHLLFLGYGLRDWNLRVILHRLWGQERLGYGSWSIQLSPSRIDREVWQDREVEILDFDLDVYISALNGRLEEIAAAGTSS